MKRKFQYILLLFFLNLNVQSQSIDNLDNSNGFLRYKFDAKKIIPKGFNLSEKLGDVEIYMTYEDSLTQLGPHKMESIALYYFKDELWKIELVAPGVQNTKGILNLLMTAYGEAYKEDVIYGKSDLKCLVYTGKKVELNLLFDFDLISSKFTFTSMRINEAFINDIRSNDFNKTELLIIENLKK